MQVVSLIGIYIAAVNIILFILMGFDKSRARRGAFRVPESTLFLFAIIGGSIGGILGMKTFRHKTKHPTFYIGFPVILAIQVVIVIYLLFLSPYAFSIM